MSRNLLAEEVDKMSRNRTRFLILQALISPCLQVAGVTEAYLWSVGASVIWLVRLNDADNTIWVHGNGVDSNPIVWAHDQLRMAPGQLHQAHPLDN